MGTLKLLMLGLVAILLIACEGPLESNAHLTPKIVFESTRNGNSQIYLVDMDGSNQTNLSVNDRINISPQFSPDGSQIVFESGPLHNHAHFDGSIYMMELDGSNQTDVSETESAESYSPQFTPDGSQIVFMIFPYDRLIIMDADGSNQTDLSLVNYVFDPADRSTLSTHLFSEGLKIVFDYNGTTWGNGNIYLLDEVVMNSRRLDWGNKTKLTENFEDKNILPQFSPDGSQIVFVSHRDDNSEIYLMNIDGSNQTNLTSNPGNDSFPQFSPDGTRIVFGSERDGNKEIYIMDSVGNNQTNLTNNSAEDYSPQFSYDGLQIVFVSERDGNKEIYIMDIDGRNPTNLSNNPSKDYSPQFQPRP